MHVSPQIVLSLLLLAVPAYAAEAPAAAPDHPAAAVGEPPAGTAPPAAAPQAAGKAPQPGAAQAPAAPAQPAGTGAAAGTPAQSPDAARVAFVSGNVAIYQLGQTDWARAASGLPIATGAWLATDTKARAEVRFGDDALALAGNSEVNVIGQHGEALQVAVPYGRVEVRLRQAPGKTEVDLPGGAVWLTAPGAYDMTVGTAGAPSRIAVFDGSARFAGGGLDQTIETGTALVLRQTGGKLSASVERAAPNEFARWAAARDRALPQSAAARQPPAATQPASGSTGPQAAAPPEQAAAIAPRPERHERHERHARVERVERHRHFRHRRYARYYRRRVYGYYAAPAPALPNPLSVLHSLVPFLP